MNRLIGRRAPMPRPMARRLSDLHPYAWLETPEQRDALVGHGMAVVAIVLAVLLALGVVPL